MVGELQVVMVPAHGLCVRSPTPPISNQAKMT